MGNLEILSPELLLFRLWDENRESTEHKNSLDPTKTDEIQPFFFLLQHLIYYISINIKLFFR